MKRNTKLAIYIMVIRVLCTAKNQTLFHKMISPTYHKTPITYDMDG